MPEMSLRKRRLFLREGEAERGCGGPGHLTPAKESSGALRPRTIVRQMIVPVPGGEEKREASAGPARSPVLGLRSHTAAPVPFSGTRTSWPHSYSGPVLLHSDFAATQHPHRPVLRHSPPRGPGRYSSAGSM